MQKIKPKYILPILLPVQMILLNILALFPEAVERYYSNGLYAVTSRLSRQVTGVLPLSIGDLIYLILIILLIRWFIIRRKSWRISWKDNALQMTGWLSVFYFLFHLLWAVNYHRETLTDKMAIETEYSDADLEAYTKKLIATTNKLQAKITGSSNDKVVVPYTQTQIFEYNLAGYRNLAAHYPFFNYEYPSVKKSLLSVPLTYMGFSGYMNPFTGEAQVNDMVPMYSFAATSCHEMAHQIGFASESEANFIGYLATINNTDPYIQYSGYSLALRYCLRNWEIRNKDTASALLKTLHPGVLENFEQSRQFWIQHETFIETGFKIFYDNFLKFNQQDEGLESYSKFVNLAVNFDKKNAAENLQQTLKY